MPKTKFASLYIYPKYRAMNTREEQLSALDRLLTIMEELREKCPWDRKQTMMSLRHLTIEETYELGDAILNDEMDEVKRELGDLLLHIFFYSKIGSETGDFDIGDVASGISEKLINRHPHIYGDVEVADEEEVKQNWENIKLKEGKKSVLEGVPAGLPSLVKASRIQDKVAGVGFDWERADDVLAKLNEEVGELKQALHTADKSAVEEEFGDVLFSLVNYARFIEVNPENALEKTNKKFIKRFRYLEDKAKQAGQRLQDMSIDQMELLWQEAKAE